MHRTRKAMALVMVSAMALAALAGCSPAEKAPKVEGDKSVTHPAASSTPGPAEFLAVKALRAKGLEGDPMTREIGAGEANPVNDLLAAKAAADQAAGKKATTPKEAVAVLVYSKEMQSTLTVLVADGEVWIPPEDAERLAVAVRKMPRRAETQAP